MDFFNSLISNNKKINLHRVLSKDNDDIKELLEKIRMKNSFSSEKRDFNELKILDENKKIIKLFNKNEFDINSVEEKEQRAIASFIASAVGDALGVHTEFEKVNYESNTYKVKDFQSIENLTKKRKKRCNIGEFSDDTSMALCLADSLYYNDDFNEIDLRIRFILWWFYGYNNCRKNERSFGLGGNISESFFEFINENFSTKYFKGSEDQQTNGNGSLMRNAAIPILFSSNLNQDNINKCMQYAKYQSLTTHSGREAYECCMVLSYLVLKNINYTGENYDSKYILKTHLTSLLNETDSIFKFSDSVTKLINSEIEDEKEVQEKIIKREYIPEFNKNYKDRDWNWKNKDFKYSPTRESLFPGYIGSYCMDALAMALHIVYHHNNCKEAILKAVNLNGDADSVACIVGQIAGSIWGLEDDLLELYKTVQEYDNSKCAKIAYLLYHKNNK